MGITFKGVGFQVIGVQCQGAVKIFDGLLVLLNSVIACSTPIVRFGIIGIKGNGFREIVNGSPVLFK